MSELNIEQIKKILPHRHPFLLIDQVLDFEPGVWARARKSITANEPFFEGHFPGYPVMPGVLILEALAQTGAIALLSEEGNEGRIALFGGVKNARFKAQVRPGDVLELECRLTARRGPLGFGEATAIVDGKIVCKAELSFALPDAIEVSSTYDAEMCGENTGLSEDEGEKERGGS